LLPALGGLLCGLTVWTFAPEASSEGTDCVIKAFHCRNGAVRNRLMFTKLLGGLFTLCTGGSAGRESIIALLGAGTASSLAQRFGLNVEDRRILLLAGAAGGIGAVLQVPLGGAFYAVEVLYASTALELSAFIPCVFASVAGYLTFGLFYAPLHPFGQIYFSGEIHHAADVMFFLLFVPVIAVLGIFFVHFVSELRNRFFRRLPLPEIFKPALGGFLLGCLALAYPQVLGGGYEWFRPLLHGELPFVLLLCLIVPKILATALTVSSGGSGGLLIPSLFIGGLIGGSLGWGCYFVMNWFGVPQYAPDITASALIGMGTFYAGVGKVPLTAAVIVCEIAGLDYWLLLPLLVLNLMHIALQSPSASLYEEQVLTPLDSEAHFGNYSVDLLRAMSVQEIVTSHFSPRISSAATLPQTVKIIASQSDTLFPVIDEQGRLTGVLQASDVWAVFRSKKKWDGLTAQALAVDVQKSGIAVVPSDDLYKALRICTLRQVSAVPVIDPKEPERLLTMLRREDIVAAYNERIAAARWE
ncbi:MAG: chloride channel protein, partial [Planctomycetaceae bacterium]|nr:chloride channel protein [Planctomycetaceae bacterium]